MRFFARLQNDDVGFLNSLNLFCQKIKGRN